MPGGAKGVLLKSKTPSITVYADSWGCWREARSMFKVMVACGNKQHRRFMGNCESVLHRPAMKVFFQVMMALSAALRRCMCGRTN